MLAMTSLFLGHVTCFSQADKVTCKVHSVHEISKNTAVKNINSGYL